MPLDFYGGCLKIFLNQKKKKHLNSLEFFLNIFCSLGIHRYRNIVFKINADDIFKIVCHPAL